MAQSSRPRQFVYPPLTSLVHNLRRNLSRRDTLAARANDIVKHAVPDLPDDANLLLNRLLHSRSHEVGDGVEVDAVGMTIVRVGHGQDDGERRRADDFGFRDDLIFLLVRGTFVVQIDRY